MNKRIITIAVIILLAAISRLLPHAPNFSPIGAMALFAGAFLPKKWMALLFPLMAMFVSDALMGFNGWYFMEQTITVYVTFLAIALIGRTLLNNKGAFRVGAASIATSTLFFITTNFAVWLGGYFHQPELYPMTMTGLMECYVAAIPFFGNTLAGDLCYSALLFGGFYLLEINVPVLARVESKN